jgi:hypothetical protein
VFWQVQAILRANEALAVDGGTLQDWLGRLYVDAVTIALRRQADQRKGVVSLWRLLEMMKGAAPVLTKARYVELHDNDVHHRRAAASHWDRVVAPGHDAIPGPLLKAKQDELRSALSHVSRYANEYVAHAAGNPHDVKLAFEDVRRAMATAFRVFRWCHLVLTADGYSTPVPAIQHPWRRVFQIAWLEPGRPAPAYRSLDELIREGDASPGTVI